MSSVSLGDLAQSVYLRRQNVELKAEMSRLTSELSSGKAQDVVAHLGGDMNYLAEVERGLRLNGVLASSAKEAATYTATMQTSLQYIQDKVSDLTGNILGIASYGAGIVPQHLGGEARSAMDAIVSTLNQSVAGRSLFAGSASDSTAMNSSDVILADLRVALSGQSTLTGIEATMDVWFGAGGGFETVAYAGGAEDMTPFQLGDGERIDLRIKADDDVFRQTLKAVAMAALSQDAALGLADDTRIEMLARAGELGLGATDSLTATRAALGHAEARIEEADVRLAAQKTSLEIARTGLLSVDPYDTVLQLEETQFRLESLYSATARLSQLSLVGFLR